MGFFDKFKKRKMIDPVFGELEFRPPDRWYASVSFEPEQSDVDVAILGNEDGPFESAKRNWPKTLNRYVALKPQIGSALKELYDQHISLLHEDEMSPDFPRAIDADDVWQSLSLINIGLNGNNDFELLYCFSESNDDTTFMISVNGDRVTGNIHGD